MSRSEPIAARWSPPLVLACAGTVALHAVAFIAVNASGSSLPDGPMRGERVTYVRSIERATAEDAALPAIAEYVPPPRAIPTQTSPKIVRKLAPVVAPEPSAVQAGEDYVDAMRLSVRPWPVDDVPIPAPEVNDHRGVLQATLVLFIDSEGNVNSVAVEQSSLPPEFEASAMQAFLQAHFHPGLLGDRPVDSRLRVEVVFDSGVPAQ